MAVAVITAGLAACGGGGSGATASGGSTALGAVKVTVLDTFGAPVPLAAVQGPLGVASTDTQGASLVALAAPDATASLTVSREGFMDKSIDVRSSPGKVNECAVTLQRIRSAAGGSLSSRSGALPRASPDGQQFTFEIELVVVGADSEPIQNLGVTDFVLRPCAPNATTDVSDCVRSATVGNDTGCAALTPTAETFQVVTGGTVRPYAAALLIDQTGSIAQSDPTGARLFSAKAFFTGLGANDLALVAAFASGPGAIIATPL